MLLILKFEYISFSQYFRIEIIHLRVATSYRFYLNKSIFFYSRFMGFVNFIPFEKEKKKQKLLFF